MEPSATVEISYTLVNDEEFNVELKVYTYTTRSIVLQCTEHFGKSFTEELTKVGGIFNGKLKLGPGWVFSNHKYSLLQGLVQKISGGEIKGKIPYMKLVPGKALGDKDKILGSIDIDPPIISNFKTLLQSMSETNGKTIMVSQDKTFVWGDETEVNKCVEEMAKPISAKFSMLGKMVVML